MMRRLLLFNQKPAQLALSWLGAFTGLFITLFGIQFFLDFRELISVKHDWLHPEYLVVNKKVSLLGSFGSPRGFSREEIQKLQALPGVESVAAFVQNRFRAGGGMKGDEMENLGRDVYTDLFFEAIPTELIDVEAAHFSWKPGEREIPIVIPQDYLRLYNFGFAPGQQLPQISPATLQSLRFTLYMDSLGSTTVYSGRIAGFSSRIQSLLVPMEFMEWANNRFVQGGEERDPSRLILVVKDPSDTKLLNVLDEEGYETNSEQLRNARLSNVLRIVFGMMISIAALIILLSMLGFMQYTQLAVQRSNYEIRTLLDLGFPPSGLFFYLGRYLFALLLSLTLLAFTALYFLKKYSAEYLGSYRLGLETGMRPEVILAALFIFVLFLAVQLYALRRSIYRLGA